MCAVRQEDGRDVSQQEREFFIDNLLVRIHSIIVMIRWTGLAPWEFEFPFPGSLTSTSLAQFDEKMDAMCRNKISFMQFAMS